VEPGGVLLQITVFEFASFEDVDDPVAGFTKAAQPPDQCSMNDEILQIVYDSQYRRARDQWGLL
jgi:hypothetical protein